MKIVVAVVALLALSAQSFAQTPPKAPEPDASASKPEPLSVLQGRPDAEGEELLGGNYTNPFAGIGFRTPANCKQVKSDPSEIVRFVNEQRNWELVAMRSSSSQPLPLSGGADKKKMGLLEALAGRLKQTNPGIEMVRQDTVNLGDYEAGMLAGRYTVGGQRHLVQQAIIQANDQLYYVLTMTSPGAKTDKGADKEDPAEKSAADAFKQMLDSVKLLDRSVIKDDQNERLFRTRAFFVNVNSKKLREMIIPEQWMRLRREGKDIGYTYIVEEPDNAGGGDGIKIGIRSRSYPDPNSQVDGETWFYVTGDRRHENWSNLVWIQNLKAGTSDQMTEIGSSDRRITRAADESGQIQLGEGKDPNQPKVRVGDVYTLNVQAVGKSAAVAPINRSLPPFYLPQGVGHLLPRLLPRREAKTFLFATYVSDRREVMMRYVDVGNEQEVELDGQRVHAVPISDRIGLEGSVTIHYISPEGKYLGSVNKDSKITVLPTDAATLQKMWSNADLSRPRAPVQNPQGSQQSTAPQQPGQ